MRPLKLTMSAFGPFASTEEIDFRELGTHPLFLINGATGAGKTTILDAICVALYGKTTGDDREGSQMRCDNAKPDQLTQVSLEFELGQRRFFIQRTPEQERAKSRGEGVTNHKSQALLKELAADGTETLLVASKVTEATAMIETFTGLDVDQFRQVMVLPQGKFRELLLADSKSREKIFSQLFQTHIYQQIEDKLKRQALDIQNENKKLDIRKSSILETADVETIEDLTQQLIDIKPQLSQAEQDKKAAQEQHTQISKALDNATELTKKFTQQAELTKELTQLTTQTDEIKHLENTIALAERAEKLQPLYRQWQDREQEQQQAIDEKSNSEKTLADVVMQLEKSQQQQLTLPELEQQQTKLEDKERQLNALVQSLEQLTELDAHLLKNQQQCQQAQQQVQQQTEQQQNYKKSLIDLKTQLKTNQQITEQQPELQQQLTQHTQWYTQAQQLTKLEYRLQEVNKNIVKLTQTEQNNQIAKQQLEEAYQQCLLEWHQGQAAILSKALKLNEPCPVCGSKTHPAPATTAKELPNKAQLDNAKTEYETALSQYETARSNKDKAQQQAQELDTEIAELKHKLTAETLLSEQQLQEKLAQIKQQIETVDAAQIKLKKIQQDIDNCDKQLVEIDLTLTKATENYQQYQAKQERLQGQQQAEKQRLPAEYQTLATAQISEKVTTNSKDIQQQIETLKKQIEKIEDQFNQSVTAHKVAKTKLQTVSELLINAQNKHNQAQADFEQALKEAKFESIVQFKRAQSTPEQLLELRNKTKSWHNQQQKLINQLELLDQELQSQTQPQLSTLREKQQASEQALAQQDKQWQQLSNRHSVLLETQTRFNTEVKKAAALTEKYAIVGTLSDVASGNSQSKISLQRFVLSVLLDDVLIIASQRLSIMSKGRYRLLRKEERAKGNKASGLELEVEDAYSSKVRAVATLSGGESFMAALALALGLSDVVQAYAGGIKLSTLFIDEGFGSLDQDALSLAISTLVELQSNGRMIGVISHVSELKEQIPIRIDLKKGVQGSKVTLVVP